MKLSNLLKKTTKDNSTSSIQKLEKNQLSKVAGGIDTATSTISSIDRSINESGISASPKPKKGK